MNEGWTILTVKEHIEKILAEKDKAFYKILEEKDKALSAALIAVKEENRKTEVAAEKRFELLNELRSGVATKDEVRALEKVVEDLKTSRDKGEGKGMGMAQFIGWIALAVAIVGGIIGIVIKIS